MKVVAAVCLVLVAAGCGSRNTVDDITPGVPLAWEPALPVYRG